MGATPQSAAGIVDVLNMDRGVVACADGRRRQVAERHTRVMGYVRPVSQWNPGKKAEFNERVHFKESKTR